MKFLVTGATGFVGSNLVDYLSAKGFHVICPVRNTRSLRHLSPTAVTVIPLDALAHYVSSHEPFDYVIHVAGATRALSYEQYYDANVRLSERLIDVFLDASHRRNLRRFVFISSQAVAGPSNNAGVPITEDALPSPISWYGSSKWAAEKLILSTNHLIPTTIMRPSTVFGPRDVDVLGIFKAVQWNIAPYIAGPDRFVSIIYVEDLVAGILAAALSEKSIGKSYFLTNPEPVIWRQFVREVAAVCGKSVLPLPIPPALLRLTALVGDMASKITGTPVLFRSDKLQEFLQTAWVCSPQSAWQDFGWRAATPLPEAIRKTYHWYKEHRWL